MTESRRPIGQEIREILARLGSTVLTPFEQTIVYPLVTDLERLLESLRLADKMVKRRLAEEALERESPRSD